MWEAVADQAGLLFVFLFQLLKVGPFFQLFLYFHLQGFAIPPYSYALGGVQRKRRYVHDKQRNSRSHVFTPQFHEFVQKKADQEKDANR